MENTPTPLPPEPASALPNTIVVTEENIRHFSSMHKWVMFFGVISILFIGGLIFMGSIFIVTTVTIAVGDLDAPWYISLIGVAYFIPAALWVVPTIYLFRFSAELKEAIAFRSNVPFGGFVSNLTSFFKSVGVTIIVSIALVILTLFIAAGIGVYNMEKEKNETWDGKYEETLPPTSESSVFIDTTTHSTHTEPARLRAKREE